MINVLEKCMQKLQLETSIHKPDLFLTDPNNLNA